MILYYSLRKKINILIPKKKNFSESIIKREMNVYDFIKSEFLSFLLPRSRLTKDWKPLGAAVTDGSCKLWHVHTSGTLG